MRSIEITWLNTINLPEVTGKWFSLAIAIFKPTVNSDCTWAENNRSGLLPKGVMPFQPEAVGDEKEV